jgi:hypothetical protein
MKLFIASGVFLSVDSAAHAQAPATRLGRLIPWAPHQVGKKPETGSDKSLEELAKNIDWLENRLNLYGTVVPKTPDVWGEARLTAHRQEFEEILKRELTEFNKNAINGAEVVQDNAFLAFALAMNAGIPNPEVPVAEIRPGQAGPGAGAVVIEQVKEGDTTTTTTTSGGGGAFASIQEPSQHTPVFQLDQSKVSLGSNITVEQTEILDQLARYLNHLHQIRRINEGDDTSDAPGYSMNLVRIPVSILPGQHTKIGYGAEITVSAEPYLGPELLPMAFREFVINDLVDQLCIPMTRFINSDPAEVDELIRAYAIYRTGGADVIKALENLNKDLDRTQRIKFNSAIDAKELSRIRDDVNKLLVAVERDVKADREKFEKHVSNLETEISSLNPSTGEANSAVAEFRNLMQESKNRSALALGRLSNPLDHLVQEKPDEKTADSVKKISSLTNEIVNDEKVLEKNKFKAYQATATLQEIKTVQEAIEITTKSTQKLTRLSINLPAGSTRRSTLPFPPSQLISNYGFQELAEVMMGIYFALRADVVNREVVHMTDVQAILREELAAAYELMRQDTMQQWWDYASLEDSNILKAIRTRNHKAITETREKFMIAALGCCETTSGYTVPICSPMDCKPFERADLLPHDRTTAVLAWCVYVESILLNERLNQDIRETVGNKPSYQNCGGWSPFYGPNPPEDARMAFNDYVQTRWPIKVFALDPQNNEQNIGDVRSLFRQMQMSIALAFATGQTNLSTALQSMRKLQRDAATIDLNRTAVGFGHGDDTFGWRFYPRFQTPPVEGNAKVLFRDLIVGGPTDKQLERGRQIEPGMRECTAIVLMPSFVPHVTFTTRSNWFRLGKQGLTADSVEDTVEYSRAIKQMETNANTCIRCAHLYRDGEVDRMVKRIKQLDRRLPLQTLECQVPVENSLGGFEIFSAGTRELSPELTGWYGAPGYDPHRGGTMFLTGDNFSVTGSKLIVGNQMVHARLISRQILEVTLPPGLATVRDRRLQKENKVGQSQDEGYFNEDVEGYVDAHIATPYGASGHLLIPVVHPPHDFVDEATIVTNEIVLVARLDDEGKVIESIDPPKTLVPIALQVPENSPLCGKQREITLSLRAENEILNASDTINLIADRTGARFQMDANDAISQFSADREGTIASKIKEHLDYLLFIKDGKVSNVSYVGTVTVLGSDNYSDVQAKGTVRINVSVRP